MLTASGMTNNSATSFISKASPPNVFIGSSDSKPAWIPAPYLLVKRTPLSCYDIATNPGSPLKRHSQPLSVTITGPPKVN